MIEGTNKQYEDVLRTTPEAATQLKVKTATMEAWRVRGGGPEYVRLSARAIRYRQSDLDRFIRDRTRTSTSEVAK
jgi:hypothetical protein